MIDYQHKILEMGTKYSQEYQAVENRTQGFTHSGLELIKEVNNLNPKLVVDVGCGINYFKNKIKNLIGFDIRYHPDLDFNCAIEDMNIAPGSVDVILALGSLQYTTREIIYKDMLKIVNWLRSGGFIVVRNNKFVSESDSVNSEYGYSWSQEWFDKISSDFGLITVKGPVLDNNTNVHAERIVWWWKKL